MSSPLVKAITDYSLTTLPLLLANESVTSSLAPWMLAALAADTATAEERVAIEQQLGMTQPEAATAVRTLLEEGPASLRSALAFWRSAALRGDELARFEAGLPAATAKGPVPSQAEADAWTATATEGLIKKFPLDLRKPSLAVLAAAIVAKVSWAKRLDRVIPPKNALGLSRMLSAEMSGIYPSPIGPLGVALNRSKPDQAIEVYSVIGAPELARPELVREAMRLVAQISAQEATPLDREALPDEGSYWKKLEGHNDFAHVPAFELRTETFDILTLPGVAETAQAFLHFIKRVAGTDRLEVEAKMSAIARYDRDGFEASAVAAMQVMVTGIHVDRRPTKPILGLHFGHPHVVIAVSTDPRYRGLPLFAAWVEDGVFEPKR